MPGPGRRRAPEAQVWGGLAPGSRCLGLLGRLPGGGAWRGQYVGQVGRSAKSSTPTALGSVAGGSGRSIARRSSVLQLVVIPISFPRAGLQPGRPASARSHPAPYAAVRPTRKGERQRPGGSLFKPLRQVIESINESFKRQLDLERHRGRTPGGVIARVMQRILALTAAIWHNDATGQHVLRSLTAYDH